MVCHRHVGLSHKELRKLLWLSLREDDGMAHRSLLSETGSKPLQAANIKSVCGER